MKSLIAATAVHFYAAMACALLGFAGQANAGVISAADTIAFDDLTSPSQFCGISMDDAVLKPMLSESPADENELSTSTNWPSGPVIKLRGRANGLGGRTSRNSKTENRPHHGSYVISGTPPQDLLGICNVENVPVRDGPIIAVLLPPPKIIT
jgi:hypothetical protein